MTGQTVDAFFETINPSAEKQRAHTYTNVIGLVHALEFEYLDAGQRAGVNAWTIDERLDQLEYFMRIDGSPFKIFCKEIKKKKPNRNHSSLVKMWKKNVEQGLEVTQEERLQAIIEGAPYDPPQSILELL